MSLYLHPDDSVTFGRPTIDRASPDVDFRDFSGGSGPQKLLLSLTSRCNLRCAHCVRGAAPQFLGHDDSPLEMSRELLDSIIEQVFPRVKATLIGGYDYGEQLLSSHITHVLERARNYPSMALELLTNGTRLGTVPGELLASAFSRIHVSLEGYEDGYASVRGVPWKTLERNLDHVLEARARWPRQPRLIVSFALCVMRPNLRDYFPLVDYAQRTGIDLIEAKDFYPNTYADSGASLLYHERERARFFRELAEYAASRNIVFCGPPEIPEDPVQRRRFDRAACSAPFETIGIHVNGKVFVCCNDAFELGRITPGTNSIEEIWRSQAYVELRRQVNTRRPPEACRTCMIVNRNPLAYRTGRLTLLGKQLYMKSPLIRTRLGRKFARSLRWLLNSRHRLNAPAKRS